MYILGGDMCSLLCSPVNTPPVPARRRQIIVIAQRDTRVTQNVFWGAIFKEKFFFFFWSVSLAETTLSHVPQLEIQSEKNCIRGVLAGLRLKVLDLFVLYYCPLCLRSTWI